MSLQEKLTSPPVIGAMISSTVAVMLALLPGLLSQSDAPAPAATPISSTQVAEVFASATPQPATDVLIIAEASSTPLALTAIPVDTVVEPTVRAQPDNTAPQANVLLLYDDVSFTVHNQSGQRLDVASLNFQSPEGRWETEGWGIGLVSDFPPNNCLRLRDMASGQRQPPATCGNLWAFQLVGDSALFWLDVGDFEVWYNGAQIATCSTAATSCPIFIG